MTGATLRLWIEDYSQPLYRYAYRLSGSAADADDLVQETFRKAMQRSEQLRDETRARNWLFGILRNEYLLKLRDVARSKIVPTENLGDLPDRADGEEPEYDGASVQAALNALDESFRTPLILFYFDDMSYRDIAEQMDLPIGTVMSRLARAKVYLKEALTNPTTAAATTAR